MEQGDEYWMLMKRRQLLKSDFQNNSINDDSWEERCFAGGCIWPPRCYSCSFCKREFRSAQALGGHMNVHRRDRAKLKQSLNTNQNHIDYDHLPNSTLTSSKLSAFSIIQQNLNIPNPTNVETDLFMGFNSVPSTPKTAVSPLSFFINPCSTDIYSIQSEVTQPDSTSMEDIDLELRLGDPPRVN